MILAGCEGAAAAGIRGSGAVSVGEDGMRLASQPGELAQAAKDKNARTATDARLALYIISAPRSASLLTYDMW
jgi:hypothetical protein